MPIGLNGGYFQEGRMSIKAKIMIIILLGCTSAAIVGGIGILGIRSANNSIETLYKENFTSVVKINQIMSLMRNNRIQLLLALQHDSRNPEIVAMHDHPLTFHTDIVTENIEEMAKTWKEYTSRELDPQEKKMADEFAEKRTRFVNEGLLPTREAILADRLDDAVHLTLTRINPLFRDANESVEKLFANETAQASRSHEDAEKQYRTMLILVGSLLAIAIALSLALGTAILRSISGATTKLMDASNAMAGGDLSKRVGLTGSDELATIGHSFDAMAESFARAIRQVADSATEVASAANELRSTAEQIANGTDEVASQASTVATAGEEMSATSGDIAQNCQLAAEGARQATESAGSGVTVVESTISVMNQIAMKVRETAKTVESLGSRSDQIGAIIGTIEDIADQTNLLALNAAIEAARAGEQGRGFAVVADEVRALAERTTRATREIGEMIKAIQSETKGAVIAMEQGVHQVEQGTDQAACSGAALQEIMEQINAVAMQVNQIATAAEEQTATTSEISFNMLQINSVVRQALEGAQESAVAARKLNDNAGELQSLVGRFKI